MDKMIFIVDDNDANLTVAASALEGEYKVLTMPSAQKMFALLEKKQPNLILLDIEMPEMTGFEAIVKLKENPQWKEIPVIFLTGLEDENLKNDSLKAGALDVVIKPIIKSTLLERVKKFI
ncbi:MAG: response regulator [Treponema sp.]|nr:response regulator [Treponema sp.]